jgi:hypothetical protein
MLPQTFLILYGVLVAGLVEVGSESPVESERLLSPATKAIMLSRFEDDQASDAFLASERRNSSQFSDVVAFIFYPL